MYMLNKRLNFVDAIGFQFRKNLKNDETLDKTLFNSYK